MASSLLQRPKELDVLQRFHATLNSSIVDPNVFSSHLISNGFLTQQTANNKMPLGISDYQKVGNLLGVVDSHIRSARVSGYERLKERFHTLLSILLELGLSDTATQMEKQCYGTQIVIKSTEPQHQMPTAVASTGGSTAFSKSMTSEQIKLWLLQKLGEGHSENIKKLRDNDVDGSIFLTLTEDDLKNEFSISSLGFRRKVVQLVKECGKQHTADVSLPLQPEITNYLLDEMKWKTASGGQETISIYQEAAHKWKKLATKLGLGEGEIDSIEREKRGNDVDCVRSVFGRWLENAQRMKHHDKYPKSWEGLLKLLGDSELSELAKKVEEALESKLQTEHEL